MAMESEIGVGVVKLKVDFAKLDKDLKRVMPKVRSAVKGGIVIDTKIKTAGMARDMRAAIKQMPHNTVKMRLDLPAFRRDIRIAADMVHALRHSLGQHPLRLNLNTSQAHTQIRNLRQALRPSLNSNVKVNARGNKDDKFISTPFGGSFGGNLAANAVSSVAGGVMSAATGSVSRGLGLNANLESYEKSLKVVIKDQARANFLFKELKQLDIDLPVEIDLLAGEAVKLAGAGFEAGKIAKMLLTLTDAAAISPVGVNEGTSRAVRAFTQMKAKGNIQMEDLNQLSEIGIPIRQIIQDQFGMSAGDLGQKTRSGEVSMDDAIAGILKGLDAKFGGALEARADTFEGLLDQVTARYNEFVREISHPVFEDLIEGLKNVVEVLKSPEFKEFTSGVKQVVGAASGIAGQTLENSDMDTGWFANISSIVGFGADVASRNFKASSESNPEDAPTLWDLASIPGMVKYAGAMSGGPLSMADLRDSFIGAAGGRTKTEVYESLRRSKEKADAKIEIDRQISMGNGLAAGTSGLLTGLADAALGKGAGGLMSGLNASALSGLGAKASGLGSAAMSSFYDQAGKARQMQSQNDLRDAKDADRETRDTKARTQGDTDRADFKQRIADAIVANPGIADALRNTEFASTLQRDENGNLRTQFEVTKLGEGPGAVQMTDFANLNSMIQGQVDQARMAKHAEDTAKATQELVKIANETHLTQKELLKKQDEKLVPIFGP
jgi:tape measure domain-containing protein